MISRFFYEEKIKEAITLLDSKISKKTVDLIYEKIKDKYEDEDFAKAIDDATQAGKLSYPYIVERLNKYSSMRLEKESLERKRKEDEETRRFWRENYYYIKQGICNRKCDACKVEICDLLAKRAIEGIKDILRGEKTPEQVNTELARQFHGIGFDEDEPF